MTARRLLGLLALIMLTGTAVYVALAGAGDQAAVIPKTLPRALQGPLRPFGLPLSPNGLLALLVAALAAYTLVLVAAGELPARPAIAALVLAHVALALAPPLLSLDVFPYVGMGRLQVVHHANPYVSGLAQAPGDPVNGLAGPDYANTPSPYGPLFGLLSAALAPLGITTAVWVLKALAALGSLATCALAGALARRLGRPALPVALAVGLNPLALIFGVGGGHNDALLMVPAVLGAVWLVTRRPAAGGGALAAGAGIKLTGLLFLAALAAGAREGRRRLVLGAALAGAVLLALALLVYGTELRGMLDAIRAMDTRDTFHGIVPYLAHLAGAPGVAARWHTAASPLLVLGLVVLAFGARRRGPVATTAWATALALMLTSWVLPWYVAWLLPWAAVAGGASLAVAVGLTGALTAMRTLPTLLDVPAPFHASAPGLAWFLALALLPALVVARAPARPAGATS